MHKKDHNVSKSQMIVLIIIFIFIVAGVGFTIYQSVINGLDFGLVSSIDYNKPLYSDVTRNLAESGENYTDTLGAGFYKVGVHIPEGKYVIRHESGSGYLMLIDEKNAINIHGYITTNELEEEYGHLSEDNMNDIRMYEGAVLRISNTARITFETKNAQLPLSFVENPDRESKIFSEKFYIGDDKDIPAGSYDITCIRGTGELLIDLGGSIYTEIVDFEPFMISEDSIIYTNVIKNVVITDGTIIEPAEGMSVMLTPSEIIESENYQQFYMTK